MFLGASVDSVFQVSLRRDRLKKCISEILSSIDCYIPHKAIDQNMKKGVKEFIKTYKRKLKNLLNC